jgi:hypothetical protein
MKLIDFAEVHLGDINMKLNYAKCCILWVHNGIIMDPTSNNLQPLTT